MSVRKSKGLFLQGSLLLLGGCFTPPSDAKVKPPGLNFCTRTNLSLKSSPSCAKVKPPPPHVYGIPYIPYSTVPRCASRTRTLGRLRLRFRRRGCASSGVWSARRTPNLQTRVFSHPAVDLRLHLFHGTSMSSMTDLTKSDGSESSVATSAGTSKVRECHAGGIETRQ